MMLSWVLWLSLSLTSQALPSNQKVKLYQAALKLEKKAKYKDAAALWTQLVGLFRKEQQTHPALSRARNQLLLGECNVLFRLAENQWKAGSRWRSCQTREELESARKRIATRWLKYVSDTSLPKRFLSSQQILRSKCRSLPSRVLLSVTPKGAAISYKAAQGKAKWQRTTNVLQIPQGSWLIRAKAKGYQTLTKRIQVPRWQEHQVKLTLPRLPTKRPKLRTQVPKPKVAIRAPKPPLRPSLRVPPPKKPPPLYATWWFWTATGVIVVGGSAAVIIAVALTPTTPELTFDPANPARVPFVTNP